MSIENTIVLDTAAQAMIIEQLTRIADSMEKMAASDPGLALVPDAAPAPAPKKKRTSKKKEAAPAPQLVPTAEPVETTQAPQPEAGSEATEEMTPEELNEGLMELAKSAAPGVVNKLFEVLALVGAKNTKEVPPNRRKWALEAATKVAAGASIEEVKGGANAG